MNETKGYALMKSKTTTGISPIEMGLFEGQIVRILDFAVNDSGVMVINAKGTGLATFDMCDVEASFKCSEYSNIITPPNLDILAKMAYATKAMMRKGAYNEITKKMVITASLQRGEFFDSFLWAKQKEDINSELREMTPEEIDIFITLTKAKKEHINELFNKLNEEAGAWVLQAINKRFKAYKIKADDKIIIMVLTMGDGVVGRCANYVDDIVKWCKENSITEIDFKMFTEKIYPHGFPKF